MSDSASVTSICAVSAVFSAASAAKAAPQTAAESPAVCAVPEELSLTLAAGDEDEAPASAVSVGAAFAADTAAWYIASYDDAVAGKITSKDDDSFTRSNPNFTAYKEEGSSLYKMQVSTGTLMVVVVDRVDRLYAYTKKEVDLEGAPPTFSVLFRPWVQQWIDTEEPDGWVVVNPALDPDKDSQTQTQPRRR